jgi:1-acyl-sn-glycerol-3-phosphate acyltransferase
MLYGIAYRLVRLVLGLLFRIEVEGRENIPEGACLVVSNHLSWLDTAFIVYALPRRPMLHTMANRSTVFNTRFKRWLLPRLAVFPVSRARGYLDEEAVNTVYQLLESGERVLIFPEGAYGKDGQLRPLKEGVGYFALNSGKPILPISVSGTDRLRPFSRVRVVIGPPFIPKAPPLLELKERVRRVVGAIGDTLERLGQRSATPRRRWWRRRSRPGRAETGPVEVDQAQVDQDRASQQQG